MSTAVARPDDAVSPAKLWWLVLALGVLTILAGFIALVYPGPTLLVVGLIFGIWLLMWGAASLYRGIHDAGSTGTRVVAVLIGVLGVLSGLVLIVRPGQSVLTVVWVLGFWWVVTGILEIMQGTAVKEHRWANIVLGVIGAVAGAIILSSPGVGLVTLVFIVSFTLILRGMTEVALAMQLRKLAKEIG